MKKRLSVANNGDTVEWRRETETMVLPVYAFDNFWFKEQRPVIGDMDDGINHA